MELTTHSKTNDKLQTAKIPHNDSFNKERNTMKSLNRMLPLRIIFWVSIASFVAAGEEEIEKPASRIINGDFAPSDAYPWFVKGGGCGGSLVSPEFVLTGSSSI